MNKFFELCSWNEVCHRTIQTTNSPDFALIAFADRTWGYFSDVLASNETDTFTPFQQRFAFEQEQEIPWEHDDYYSHADQLADEANADYWDQVARERECLHMPNTRLPLGGYWYNY